MWHLVRAPARHSSGDESFYLDNKTVLILMTIFNGLAYQNELISHKNPKTVLKSVRLSEEPGLVSL